MRKLIYSMNVTLDGYVAARGDDIGWGVPGAELHQWFNDRARETGVSLYGRRLWELMNAHWPTADQQPDVTPVEAEFAQVWQETPKVVFSTTLDQVSQNARLVSGDAVAEITRLKAEDGAPMEIGGGTPFFSTLDSWVNLRLVQTRTFPHGVTLSHDETMTAVDTPILER